MKICRSYNLQHMHGWELMKRKFTPMRGGVWRVPDNTLVCTCRSQDARCIQSCILTILLRWGEPLISFIRPCLLRYQADLNSCVKTSLLSTLASMRRDGQLLGPKNWTSTLAWKNIRRRKGPRWEEAWPELRKVKFFTQTKILVQNFTPKTRNLRLICFRD